MSSCGNSYSNYVNHEFVTDILINREQYFWCDYLLATFRAKRWGHQSQMLMPLERPNQLAKMSILGQIFQVFFFLFKTSLAVFFCSGLCLSVSFFLSFLSASASSAPRCESKKDTRVLLNIDYLQSPLNGFPENISAKNTKQTLKVCLKVSLFFLFFF